MRALWALTRAEGRLYLREPMNVFFGLVFPTLLIFMLGFLIPAMQETVPGEPGFADLRIIDLFAPIILALAIATVSLTTLPPVFGSYRERGVLRRLSTTPLPASRLLIAQVAVNVAAVVVAVALALVGGVALLDLALPTQPLLVVGAFLLAAVEMISLGCLISAVVPTAAGASGLGMVLYFPMLFFAGVWLPGPLMPAGLAQVSGWTPLGAASQAMTEGWFGSGVPVQQLVVMVIWTLVLVPLAARLFRWS